MLTKENVDALNAAGIDDTVIKVLVKLHGEKLVDEVITVIRSDLGRKVEGVTVGQIEAWVERCVDDWKAKKKEKPPFPGTEAKFEAEGAQGKFEEEKSGQFQTA